MTIPSSSKALTPLVSVPVALGNDPLSTKKESTQTNERLPEPMRRTGGEKPLQEALVGQMRRSKSEPMIPTKSLYQNEESITKKDIPKTDPVEVRTLAAYSKQWGSHFAAMVAIGIAPGTACFLTWGLARNAGEDVGIKDHVPKDVLPNSFAYHLHKNAVSAPVLAASQLAATHLLLPTLLKLVPIQVVANDPAALYPGIDKASKANRELCKAKQEALKASDLTALILDGSFATSNLLATALLGVHPVANFASRGIASGGGGFLTHFIQTGAKLAATMDGKPLFRIEDASIVEEYKKAADGKSGMAAVKEGIAAAGSAVKNAAVANAQSMVIQPNEKFEEIKGTPTEKAAALGKNLATATETAASHFGGYMVRDGTAVLALGALNGAVAKYDVFSGKSTAEIAAQRKPGGAKSGNHARDGARAMVIGPALVATDYANGATRMKNRNAKPDVDNKDKFIPSAAQNEADPYRSTRDEGTAIKKTMADSNREGPVTTLLRPPFELQDKKNPDGAVKIKPSAAYALFRGPAATLDMINSGVRVPARLFHQAASDTANIGAGLVKAGVKSAAIGIGNQIDTYRGRKTGKVDSGGVELTDMSKKGSEGSGTSESPRTTAARLEMRLKNQESNSADKGKVEITPTSSSTSAKSPGA